MRNKGSYTYQIAPRDIDFARRPALVAVCDYILDAADQDADRNGFGLGSLMQNNWTWVLTRFCVEFDRYPGEHETLNVQTWVSQVNRLMTNRNFQVADAAGTPMASAVSNWAMLDMTTRKALDLSTNLEYSDAIIDDPSPIEPPARIARATPDEIIEHRVVYSDLDFNLHTNSLRYIGMMMDMLPMEYHEKHTLRRMDINFLHESRYGDTLSVAVQKGNPVLFEIQNQERQLVCRAQMQWIIN